MKRSIQLKVRLCGSCWKEKYVCVRMCLTVKLTLSSSVKTNHEIGAALVPGYFPEYFVLDLLPSADDGGSTLRGVTAPGTDLTPNHKFIMLSPAPRDAAFTNQNTML